MNRDTLKLYWSVISGIAGLLIVATLCFAVVSCKPGDTSTSLDAQLYDCRMLEGNAQPTCVSHAYDLEKAKALSKGMNSVP